MSKSLFITGTGTDIGKTYVTGLIVKKLQQGGKNPAYFKAAMSGNSRREDGSLIPGDALQVQNMSGIAQPLEEMCPYVYEKAYSPHLAAQLEGNPIDLPHALDCYHALTQHYDYITLEGSGGILCPLRFDEQEKLWLTDFIKAARLSSLLIADAGLGTINSVVLTVEYMNSHHLPLKGIIFNNYEKGNILHEDNLAMCEYMTGLKVLACVAQGDTELNLDLEDLCSLYD